MKESRTFITICAPTEGGGMEIKMKRKLMYLILILGLSVLTACGNKATEVSDAGEKLGDDINKAVETSGEEVTYLLSKVKYRYDGEDEYYYDEKGMLLKMIYTYPNSDEKSYAYVLTEYDEKGNPILEEDVFEFDRCLVVERTEYENTYDGEGNLRSTVGKKTTGTEVIIEYNENGKVIKRSEDGSDIIYEYDENDLLIRKRYVYPDRETISEYNEMGDVISTEVRNVEGELIVSDKYKYEYQYDDNGKMIKKTEYDVTDSSESEVETVGEENIRVYTYEYDEHGNLIRETLDSLQQKDETIYEYITLELPKENGV